jgi:DNA-binding CsgD family transcriptional regulator
MDVSTRVDAGVVDAVERAAMRVPTVDELFEVVGEELRKSVPYDGACWFGVDPATMLAIHPSRVEGLEAGYCDIFWQNEFHEQDVALFRDLARQSVPAASVHQLTGGRPLSSARFRDFLQPQGFIDELRAVCRVGESAWAIAGLYRGEGREPFDDDEVALMSALSSVVASALRTKAASSAGSSPLTAAPGLLLFDPDNTLVSANAEAAKWLSDLWGTGPTSEHEWIEVLSEPGRSDLDRLHFSVIPLLVRARAVAAGYEDRQARLRIRDRSGRWLVLHASALAGANGKGGVAVVIEPAKSGDIAPIIIEAYGLSVRERDVVRAIARGASTPEIAADLYLSAHTVRDYIKSVFEKIGVTSRSELVAKLFAEHYADPFHDSMVDVG